MCIRDSCWAALKNEKRPEYIEKNSKQGNKRRAVQNVSSHGLDKTVSYVPLPFPYEVPPVIKEVFQSPIQNILKNN